MHLSLTAGNKDAGRCLLDTEPQSVRQRGTRLIGRMRAGRLTRRSYGVLTARGYNRLRSGLKNWKMPRGFATSAEVSQDRSLPRDAACLVEFSQRSTTRRCRACARRFNRNAECSTELQLDGWSSQGGAGGMEVAGRDQVGRRKKRKKMVKP